MTSNRGRVLLAGETWLTYGIHQKGFSAYTTGGYEVGSDEFLAALQDERMGRRPHPEPSGD
ncbi:MAG: glutamine amidotransferase [Nocardioidaceae bacterium]